MAAHVVSQRGKNSGGYYVRCGVCEIEYPVSIRDYLKPLTGECPGPRVIPA